MILLPHQTALNTANLARGGQLSSFEQKKENCVSRVNDVRRGMQKHFSAGLLSSNQLIIGVTFS